MSKEKGKEKKAIDLPRCELDSETGQITCKVSPELYDKIRKGAIVNKVTFEVEVEQTVIKK